MLKVLGVWFLYFIICSCIGWVVEMITTFIRLRKIYNRGFLIGPICPIYGTGAVLASLVLNSQDSVIAIFCVSLVGASILEYFTSYFMEKIFHARWWDYKNIPFNLNGRICLPIMIVFGLVGVFMIKIFNPFYFKFMSSIDSQTIFILSSFICVLFIADLIGSAWLMFRFQVTKHIKAGDSSEEISKKVRILLGDTIMHHLKKSK